MILIQRESPNGGMVRLGYRLGDRICWLAKLPWEKFSRNPLCWLAELMLVAEFHLITKVREDLDLSDQLCEDLGFCGCGNPDQVYEWLGVVLSELNSEPTADKGVRILNAMGFKAAKVNQIPPIAWLMLYWMGDRGWIEHGSTCLYSWLTEKGEEVLARIQRGEYIEVSREGSTIEKVGA